MIGSSFLGVGLLDALGVAEPAMASRYVPASACFSANAMRTSGSSDVRASSHRIASPTGSRANMWAAVSLEKRRSRPVRFAEGPGGIPAHGEILTGSFRPWTIANGTSRWAAQGLVLVGVGLALEHQAARDGERPGDLLGEIHEETVGQPPPLGVSADEVSPDRIGLPQLVEGLGDQPRALAVGGGETFIGAASHVVDIAEVEPGLSPGPRALRR